MPPPALPRPIHHKVFFGRPAKPGIRLAGASLLSEKIASAHQQAEEWLNTHPTLKIISISNGAAENSGGSAVYVTVWYRES